MMNPSSPSVRGLAAVKSVIHQFVGEISALIVQEMAVFEDEGRAEDWEHSQEFLSSGSMPFSSLLILV